MLDPPNASLRDSQDEDALTLRQLGRVAALLFIAGAVLSIPVSLLLEPRPETLSYVLVAIGLISGVICLLLPWEQLSERWLYVLPAVATIEIAFVVAATDPIFSFLYFLVAIYASLLVRSLIGLIGQIALIWAALLAPLLYSDISHHDTLILAAALAPVIAVTAITSSVITSELRRSREAFRVLSRVDGLTGVGNYRSLQERLAQECASHARRERKFALLALDLDDFKGINEQQGHMVGDVVLSLVGGLLALEVRTEDTVFRQGGDEFAVLAEETSPREAARLVKRLEQTLAGVRSGGVTTTATIGIAIFPDDASDPAGLMAAADAAMMDRKRARNGGRRRLFR